jgi:hypothetical protein
MLVEGSRLLDAVKGRRAGVLSPWPTEFPGAAERLGNRIENVADPLDSCGQGAVVGA